MAQRLYSLQAESAEKADVAAFLRQRLQAGLDDDTLAADLNAYLQRRRAADEKTTEETPQE